MAMFNQSGYSVTPIRVRYWQRAPSIERRASSWPMSTRGLLLIARGRKADNLTFSYPRSLNRAKYIMIKLIQICIILTAMCCISASAQDTKQLASTGSVNSHETSIPVNAQILIQAYPELNLMYVDNHIVFQDGTSIIYDDGIQKDYLNVMDHSDIEDMFSMDYLSEGNPGYLQDAGRSRCEDFFKKVYGENAKAVKQNLNDVKWFGTTVKFNRINGAAKQLQKVADEIQSNYPEYIPYMKSSGTFYWRKVRGSERLSSHSYGIAIDIAVKQSDYWRWGNPKAKETDEIGYKNRIPLKIAEIFEKHGFIWGGRWYHYDTMHFEYRPEILKMHQEKSKP